MVMEFIESTLWKGSCGFLLETSFAMITSVKLNLSEREGRRIFPTF